MKKIFVCSPLRNKDPEIQEHNLEMAKIYCKRIAKMGHLPIAPHVYFTQFLTENSNKERELGINLGLELLKGCDELWALGEWNESEGCDKELNHAIQNHVYIEYDPEIFEGDLLVIGVD